MRNKLTVSVGIPAYNEEANIRLLLDGLLKQKIKNIILEKIVVVSDGSSDQTVSQAKLVKNPLIKIIDRKNRLGLNETQNEIAKQIKSDVLVLIDADTLPNNIHFIEEIVKPIDKDKEVGIVSAETISLKPNTFVEKIISQSHQFKKTIYEEINNSDNIYLCHGRARAFSKVFYNKLRWPNVYPEDAYSYLFCIKSGYKFVYNSKAKILFRSPSTFTDHIKQSRRFIEGKKKLEKNFSSEYMKKQFRIPIKLLLNKTLKFLISNPFSAFPYIIVNIYIRSVTTKKQINSSKYDVSLSSKTLL